VPFGRESLSLHFCDNRAKGATENFGQESTFLFSSRGLSQMNQPLTYLTQIRKAVPTQLERVSEALSIHNPYKELFRCNCIIGITALHC
jgi:hypothetical protein